jgi:hypothetical protein
VLRGRRPALLLFVTLSLILLTIVASGFAGAAVVVHDDFDDGRLDGAWTLTFINTNAWTYVETGTRLTVTDIDDVQRAVRSQWCRSAYRAGQHCQ